MISTYSSNLLTICVQYNSSIVVHNFIYSLPITSTIVQPIFVIALLQFLKWFWSARTLCFSLGCAQSSKRICHYHLTRFSELFHCYSTAISLLLPSISCWADLTSLQINKVLLALTCPLLSDAAPRWKRGSVCLSSPAKWRAGMSCSLKRIHLIAQQQGVIELRPPLDCVVRSKKGGDRGRRRVPKSKGIGPTSIRHSLHDKYWTSSAHRHCASAISQMILKCTDALLFIGLRTILQKNLPLPAHTVFWIISLLLHCHLTFTAQHFLLGRPHLIANQQGVIGPDLPPL